jgi:hypothetical protein
MTVNALNLLPAAINGEIIEVRRFNPIEIPKYLWFDPAKARSVGIDATFSRGSIEVDTPAVWSN